MIVTRSTELAKIQEGRAKIAKDVRLPVMPNNGAAEGERIFKALARAGVVAAGTPHCTDHKQGVDLPPGVAQLAVVLLSPHEVIERYPVATAGVSGVPQVIHGLSCDRLVAHSFTQHGGHLQPAGRFLVESLIQQDSAPSSVGPGLADLVARLRSRIDRLLNEGQCRSIVRCQARMFGPSQRDLGPSALRQHFEIARLLIPEAQPVVDLSRASRSSQRATASDSEVSAKALVK